MEVKGRLWVRDRVQLGAIGLCRCEGLRVELWDSRTGGTEEKAAGEILEKSVTLCIESREVIHTQ